MILHVHPSLLPELRFEYHPQTAKIFVIRVGQKPEIGEPIADHIDDQEVARRIIAAYIMGYRAAQLANQFATAAKQEVQ